MNARPARGRDPGSSIIQTTLYQPTFNLNYRGLVMAVKEVSCNDEARQGMFRGVNVLVNAAPGDYDDM